jgi:hypothetical protein
MTGGTTQQRRAHSECKQRKVHAVGILATNYREPRTTHNIRIVDAHSPGSILVHLFMTLAAPAHCQCGVHVHVVARIVKAN